MTVSRMREHRDTPASPPHEGCTVIMGLIVALVVVSIALVVLGIAIKGILWLAAIGALLLLGTFVFVGVSSRAS